MKLEAWFHWHLNSAETPLQPSFMHEQLNIFDTVKNSKRFLDGSNIELPLDVCRNGSGLDAQIFRGYLHIRNNVGNLVKKPVLDIHRLP